MERFRQWHEDHRHDGLPYDTYMGLTIENDRLRNAYHRTAISAIRAWEKVQGTEIIAPTIRKNGPRIFVSTHPTFVSTLHLPYVVAEITGRVPVMTPKRSLVDPLYIESAEVLEATGKTDLIAGVADTEDENTESEFPLKGIIFQKILSARARVITESLDIIPVDRKPSLSAMKETKRAINQALKEGRILGTFLQWTRTEENSLENTKPFAASIMRDNPDIPVHIIVQQLNGSGMEDPSSLRHPRMFVSEPFVLLGEDRRLSNNGIHRLLLGQTEALMRQAGMQHIVHP